MRRVFVSALAFFCFAALALLPAAQQPTPSAPAYQNRCATCHGATMAGGTGPSVLSYIRYHTDAEVRAALGAKHKAMALPDTEVQQILKDIRVLAGTNPSMATGGYTGRRSGGAGRGAAPAGA